MQIAIFNDLTTEQALVIIEEEAAKYDGLHVEMSNDEQRKFVKGQASNIKDLLKKLEVSRVEKTKTFRNSVEAEAARIKTRLEEANKPFTLLIDEYAEKCAQKREKEKAIQAAKDLAIKIEQDQEDAITLDKMRTFEAQEAARIQQERDEQIAKEASAKAEQEKEEAQERAEQAEKDKILAEAKAKRDAEQAEKDRIEAAEQAEKRRLIDVENAKQYEIKRQADEKARLEAEKARLEANTRHVGSVRRELEEYLIDSCGINEKEAKKVVKALHGTPRITVNY